MLDEVSLAKTDTNASHSTTHDSVQTLLDFWFSTLDDQTVLDPEREPFRTCFRRWYGKDPNTDAEVRARFEPLLQEVTRAEQAFQQAVAQFERHERGLLALLVLVDQLPRNMYRDTKEMYRHDERAAELAQRAIARHASDAELTLTERMFLYVPLLHAEDLDSQRQGLSLFESLRRDAAMRSPHNDSFYAMAEDFARRHLAVIEQFGRFPHRNAILGRESTADELAHVAKEGGF
jgi:uncharacterized protein (DUF924 family)